MDNYKFTFDEIKPGMILESTWGYSMTIVDFYKVVGKRGKTTVDLVRLFNEVTEGSGLQGHAIPVLDTSKANNGHYSARITKDGYLKLSGGIRGTFLVKWDDKPVLFDHMD